MAALLSGCSGEGGINTSVLGPPTAAAEGAALTTGSTADKPQFNPFADASAQATKGREVIVNPTVAEVMQPASDLPEITVGKADAPVTIIKYESLTCPYCKQFQTDVYPVLKREYIDTGKVRFILREFPIGKQSGSATIAMRCAPEGKRLELYDKFMKQQGVLGQPGSPPRPDLQDRVSGGDDSRAV